MWKYVAGIFAFIAIAAFFFVKGYRAEGDAKSYSLITGIILVPIIAWFASRLIVHGVFGAGSWLRYGSKKKWSGLYFEYATIHLRAMERGGALVFVEEDILHVIEQPDSVTPTLFGPTERIEVDDTGLQALTESGCERLLIKCPHPQAKGLLTYLKREAFGPYAKRHKKPAPGPAALPPDAPDN